MAESVKSFGINGEPGRNRTFTPQIKSLLLCQLSYWPTCGKAKRSFYHSVHDARPRAPTRPFARQTRNMKLRSILTLLLGAVGLLAISATVALIILSSVLHDAGVRIATAVDRVRLVMDLESRVLQRMQQRQAPDDGHVSRIRAAHRRGARDRSLRSRRSARGRTRRGPGRTPKNCCRVQRDGGVARTPTRAAARVHRRRGPRSSDAAEHAAHRRRAPRAPAS